jgi:hypothetical protein
MKMQTVKRKMPKDRVGYVSKSKAGNSILTVEQDVVLKAGQKIILQKPTDVIDGLLKRGILTEEQAESRKSSVPEWKTHEASLLPDRD